MDVQPDDQQAGEHINNSHSGNQFICYLDQGAHAPQNDKNDDYRKYDSSNNAGDLEGLGRVHNGAGMYAAGDGHCKNATQSPDDAKGLPQLGQINVGAAFPVAILILEAGSNA